MTTATRVRLGWTYEDVDYELLVSVSAGSPGRGPDMNGPGWPPEDPEVEVLEVADEHGVQHSELVEVAQKDLDPGEAIEAAEDKVMGEMEDAAEREADRRDDR